MRELQLVAVVLFMGACNCSTPPLKAACTADKECGAASACQQGGCVTCSACDAGDHCLRAQCLPGSCGSMLCAEDQACIGGACGGANCVGVLCPGGQSCVDGQCYPVNCGAQTCVPGTVCYNNGCVSAPCVGVDCPSGQMCADGQCLATTCGGVTCTSGQVCVNATCVDATCVGVLCSSDAKCVAGACVPVGDAGTPDAGTPDAGTLCPDAQLTCSIQGTVYACGVGTSPSTCEVCLPNVSTSGFTALPDGTPCGTSEICAFGNCVAACFIAGAVVPMGTVDPTDSCRACQPALSLTGYTAIADGTPCAVGKVCHTGACTDGCFIMNAFVPANAINPAGTCQQCRPANTSTAWSDSTDGTSCAQGKVCASGSCTSDCFIDGGLYDAGTLDPLNPCHDCQPQVSTTAFSNLPDTSVCGAGATCHGGTCDCAGGQKFCAPKCVDLANSTANCGGCGNLCDAGTACFANACVRPKAMPTPRTGLAAATLADGRIFVMGGGTPFGVYGGNTNGPGVEMPFDTVEIYTPATNSWASGPPLLTARVNLAAVTGRDGRIFTFGGYSGSASSNSVEIYDATTGTWTSGTAMPLAREDPGVTVGADGRIYVVAGGDYVQAYHQLQVYDPGGNAWASLADCPQTSGGAGFATGTDGKLYLVGSGLHSGACTAGALTWVYDGGSNSWSQGPSLTTARMASSVLTGADGRIYAIGGGAGCADMYLRAVEVLAPGGTAWSPLAQLNVGRLGAGAALGKDGRMYIFGGKGQAGDGGLMLNSVEVYDPSVGRWTASP